MVYSYVCNGFFADPTWELPTGASRSMDSEKLCNYLQNVGATTYILVLQLSTFLFYNKQSTAECIAIHNGIEYEKMIEYFDTMNHSDINVRKHSRYIFSKALETTVEDDKLYIGDILKREYPFVSKWRLLEATQEDEYSVYYLVPAED